MRINAFLAKSGIASRRGADKLIKAGRVSINGQTAQLHSQISADDLVEVDGKPIQGNDYRYIILNKPVGYITTLKDEHDRPTVTDLVDIPERVVPVGRLDQNTSGLLVLTNDGILAHRLMHPSFEVDKTYIIETDRKPTAEILNKLSNGLDLDGRTTAPAKVERLEPKKVRLTIHEGRKRQIRRMFGALGLSVTNLERTEYAGLSLAGLKPGLWRHLTLQEVKNLKQLVGMVK